MTLVFACYFSYELTCSILMRVPSVGNASAEGGDEGADSAQKQGVDIVMNSRLVEYAMAKKDYMTHIKGYMKQ